MGQPIQNPPPWSKSKAVPSAVHDLFMQRGPGSAKWSPPKMQKMASAMGEGLNKNAWAPLISGALALGGRLLASTAVRSVATQAATGMAADAVAGGARKMFAPKPKPVQTQQYALPKVAMTGAELLMPALINVVGPAVGSVGSTIATMHVVRKFHKKSAPTHDPMTNSQLLAIDPNIGEKMEAHDRKMQQKKLDMDKKQAQSESKPNPLHKLGSVFGAAFSNANATKSMMIGTPERRSATASRFATSMMGHGKALAASMAVPMAIDAGMKAMSKPKRQKKQTQNQEQPGQQAGPPARMY
jgi:hypothetical protein